MMIKLLPQLFPLMALPQQRQCFHSQSGLENYPHVTKSTIIAWTLTYLSMHTHTCTMAIFDPDPLLSLIQPPFLMLFNSHTMAFSLAVIISRLGC